MLGPLVYPSHMQERTCQRVMLLLCYLRERPNNAKHGAYPHA